MPDLDEVAKGLRLIIKDGKNDEAIRLIEQVGVDRIIHDIGTPLSVACLFENWEVAKYCIEQGADVDARNSDGATPLHDACTFGNLEVATLLVAKGADINAKDTFARTPIAQAISFRPDALDLIEFLLAHGADPFIYEDYRPDDPRITTRTAYDFAKEELEDEQLVALLDKYATR